MVTIMAGVLVFHDPISVLNATGVLVTVGGMLGYNLHRIRHNEQQEASLQDSDGGSEVAHAIVRAGTGVETLDDATDDTLETQALLHRP